MHIEIKAASKNKQNVSDEQERHSEIGHRDLSAIFTWKDIWDVTENWRQDSVIRNAWKDIWGLTENWGKWSSARKVKQQKNLEWKKPERLNMSGIGWKHPEKWEKNKIKMGGIKQNSPEKWESKKRI